MFHYQVFGLHLSSNLPIPILTHSCIDTVDSSPKSQKIEVLFEQDPGEVDSYSPIAFAQNCDDSGKPLVTLLKSPDNLIWLFHYSDGTRFFLKQDGSRIWADWVAPMTFEDTLTYLVGTILAYALHLKKVPVLHGSAVTSHNTALVFVGPGGSGKSTLAASFAHIRTTVLTDDLVAIREEDRDHFFCEPGYHYLRLWEDSSEMLLGSPDVLPLISANWDKRHLALNPGNSFQKVPAVIGAIYILDRHALASQIRIEPLTRREALVLLLSNKYTVRTLNQEAAIREFDCLSKMVRRVPVRRVKFPENRLLFEFRDAILQDFTTLVRQRDIANLKAV
jgi:hypothetical protein